MLFFVDVWPKTLDGRDSTAGTTASVVFIRNSRIYIGNVGDSTVVLGKKKTKDSSIFAEKVTEVSLIL